MKTVVVLALLLSAAGAETPYVIPTANPAPADSSASAQVPARLSVLERVPTPVFTLDRGPARFVAHDGIVLEIPLP